MAFGKVGFRQPAVQLLQHGSRVLVHCHGRTSIRDSWATSVVGDKTVVNKVTGDNKKTWKKLSSIVDPMSGLNGFMELNGNGQ
ncbi:unnamed protein product [Penicillium camemberti]|uniref:Str. FM013 n=1 Tax=Penicillium camemberti (strain FM 013) TaxID=1429867 RepID=A0A0G4PE24_PENC3|nr:unnamed protein product [Penicillium camemberti]